KKGYAAFIPISTLFDSTPRKHLHEQLVGADSKEVRKILVSHLDLVNARIEELLSQPTEPETRTTTTGAGFYP
ncbi:MAG: hypothetical protein AAB309_05455, partial [Deltaproteobacteria bacterium]